MGLDAQPSYLVVANQTIVGGQLESEIRRRIDAAKSANGVASFHLVVPVQSLSTASAVLLSDPVNGFSPIEMVGQLDHDTREAAEVRLDATRRLIMEAGAEASGATTYDEPLQAVLAALASLRPRTVDEIIVSTLPRPISKWLHVDLPSRLARATKLPVTHVESLPAPVG